MHPLNGGKLQQNFITIVFTPLRGKKKSLISVITKILFLIVNNRKLTPIQIHYIEKNPQKP